MGAPDDSLHRVRSYARFAIEPEARTHRRDSLLITFAPFAVVWPVAVWCIVTGALPAPYLAAALSLGLGHAALTARAARHVLGLRMRYATFDAELEAATSEDEIKRLLAQLRDEWRCPRLSVDPNA